MGRCARLRRQGRRDHRRHRRLRGRRCRRWPALRPRFARHLPACGQRHLRKRCPLRRHGHHGGEHPPCLHPQLRSRYLCGGFRGRGGRVPEGASGAFLLHRSRGIRSVRPPCRPVRPDRRSGPCRDEQLPPAPHPPQRPARGGGQCRLDADQRHLRRHLFRLPAGPSDSRRQHRQHPRRRADQRHGRRTRGLCPLRQRLGRHP